VTARGRARARSLYRSRKRAAERQIRIVLTIPVAYADGHVERVHAVIPLPIVRRMRWDRDLLDRVLDYGARYAARNLSRPPR
jgi:hypothetical protein